MEPIYETDRLYLSKPTLEFAEAIFTGYANDPKVTTYMSWAPHTSVQDTVDFLQKVVQAWEDRTEYSYVISIKTTGEVIGMIGAMVPSSFHYRIGYVLGANHWGKGYTTEALQRIMDEAMAQPEVHRVDAICDCNNTGSWKVMEKAGMEREAMLRKFILEPNLSDQPQDIFVYAKIKETV